MSNPLLRSLISEMIESYLEKETNTRKNRVAVLDANKKIPKLGGNYNKSTRTYHIGNIEIGHEENGRTYLDRDIAKANKFITY